MRPEWATRISLENLRPLASLFSEDLAIDLGTVNTRVYARGRGIVVNESSAVALDDSTGEVQAVGKEAKEIAASPPCRRTKAGKLFRTERGVVVCPRDGCDLSGPF
jgi:hypothetical protein